MRRLFALALLSVACATATPAGEKIRVTENPQGVEGCTLVGRVFSGPAVGIKDTETKLRNKVAALGGDTLFIAHMNRPGQPSSGEAYRCGRTEWFSRAVPPEGVIESPYLACDDPEPSIRAEFVQS